MTGESQAGTVTDKTRNSFEDIRKEDYCSEHAKEIADVCKKADSDSGGNISFDEWDILES